MIAPLVFLLLASAAGRPVDVAHYDVTVEPGIADKTVKGRVVIEFATTAGPLTEVDLDIGALTIDSVREGGAPLEFTAADRRVHVRLEGPATPRKNRRIDIAYHGAPRFGLEFVPEKSETYTIFSTSQWMPAIDAPSDKATLRLRLIVPAGLRVVANGRPVATRSLQGGREEHEWRLDRQAPTYTFGFAAAPFAEVTEKHGRTVLRYLSTAATSSQLRQIFALTRDMMTFFEERSGVPYPGGVYAQALVEKTIGQELKDFSLMSEEYGRGVLADPSGIGLIAHELAHQWWGNEITCLDWTHFWLNEGFATFMAGAYREKRFGREAYLKEVETWRARYERVKAAGKDRSLVFPDWNRPTSEDRALVYQKGALVLHALRERLGEELFWRGLGAYTRGHFSKSVTTADFQRAMERSTGKDLSDFFDEWVYLASKGGS